MGHRRWDKTSLDIRWIKDKSLTGDTVENIEAALERFLEIMNRVI